ncbi:ATPase [Mobiluncus mulieris]|uniref:ATPase n=1 Tax=Mobiluncus mulieris TaxID=2052 RepID=A0ABD4TW24_9ACTO|nr:ATPase [Mobiluncus mulieris]MCU9972825.1 ATPase [Mobiluncus mulieris]MCU9993888.1 ATPase [Mobiluncus mulieris]MCV0009046.1 ATPase [Mobiluncus mulieris]NMW74925.1 ATPase [Mobiluncus mulieris]
MEGFADASPVRPPVLTAQGREDVERLRAKVRAHNPGYIYANGVSLPSQLPSVPELLDELARNVAGAKGRSELPARPLPEVEPSELAKAGFDWRAIADRAIVALEQGSHRPLPLANDPEAAAIPGLSVIAAARGTTPEPSPSESTEPTPAAGNVSVESEEPVAVTAQPEVVPPATEVLPEEPVDASIDTGAIVEPEPTAIPEVEAFVQPLEPGESDTLEESVVLPEEPVVDTLAAPDLMETAAVQVPGEGNGAAFEDTAGVHEAPHEMETEATVASESMSEDLTAARVYDGEVLEPAANDDELFVGDIEPQPEIEPIPAAQTLAAESLTADLDEETPVESALVEEMPLAETPAEVSGAAFEDMAGVHEAPHEMETEATVASESRSEDLTAARVYDGEVLEPAGNDDELFVGDIEPQPEIEPNQVDELPEEISPQPAEPEEALAVEEGLPEEGPEAEDALPEEISAVEEVLPEEAPEAEDALPEEISELAEAALPDATEETSTETADSVDEAQLDDGDSLEELPGEIPADIMAEDLPPTLPTEEPDVDALAEESGETPTPTLWDDLPTAIPGQAEETEAGDDVAIVEPEEDLAAPSEEIRPEEMLTPEAETELADFDLDGLDLDELDETPLEDSLNEEITALDEALPPDGQATETGTVESDADAEVLAIEPEDNIESTLDTSVVNELPGSAAIGLEAPEPVDTDSGFEPTEVDLGEFEFGTVTGEDEDTSEEATEFELAPHEVEDNESLEENITSDAMGEQTDDAPETTSDEISFESTPDSGDAATDPSEDYASDETGGDLDDTGGADTELFEENTEDDESLAEVEAVEPPAKKGFFRRLFGR